MTAVSATIEEPNTAPTIPVVQVTGLGRTFGRRVVLANISFSIAPRIAYGITGANGSGKTVLLRLLASLDRPTSGQASIHGADTVRNAHAVRASVGYVPEMPLMYDGISADHYLQFVARSRGLSRQKRTIQVSTLLQIVGLEQQQHRLVDTFSPGERRRLALASALIHEPDVLLLDDPLRGLDGYARLEQLEVLRELRRIGTTIVMAATRPDDLMEVCDIISVLRGGSFVWTGDDVALADLAEPRLASAHRIRVHILDGLESGLALLSQRRDIRELEVDEDGQTVWFLFSGDQAALAGLVPQFVRAGCSIAHFGVEKRSAANALATLFVGTAA